MAKGNYDHPSYLTRQQICLGSTVAGNAGTSAQFAALSDMNLRNVIAVVQTAGTSTNNIAKIYAGTSSLGQIALSTSAIGSTGTTGDLNTKITQGTVLSIVNGADATGVARVTIEANIAADTGTWS